MTFGVVLGTETEFLVCQQIENTEKYQNAPEPTITAVTGDTLVALLSFITPKFGDPLRFNGFINNGGRIYIDGPFIEYSTPECASVKQLVTYEEAGMKILEMATEKYFEATGNHVKIFKIIPQSTRESQAKIPGYHENYGLPKDLYFNIFMKNFWPREIVMKLLIPFLVTRQIYCGAGCISSGETGTYYGLSQRAKWIEKIFNYTSTRGRPILEIKRPNREETHYPIHITSGDPHISQYSTFLKIGTTAVLLWCLSQGVMEELDLEFIDPVEAFKKVSKFPKYSIRMKTGSEAIALNVQQRLLSQVKKNQSHVTIPYNLEWDSIVGAWEETLKYLESNFLFRPDEFA